MSLDKNLLALLRCPQSGHPMRLMTRDELDKVATHLAQHPIKHLPTRWEAGLTCQYGTHFYPVLDGIPVLLAGDSVTASDLSS